MTSDRPGELSHDLVWLTPTPAGREIVVEWTHPTGEWQITTHWATVGGRAAMVGIDVRSFRERNLDDPVEYRMPVGDRLAEVTGRLLREVPLTEVRDTTRADMLRDAEGMQRVFPTEEGYTIGAEYAERAAALTAKGEPRKRRPPATRELLEQVAALYSEAVKLGDPRPATFVYDRLVAGGLHTTPVQVRKWIQRARERGLDIPPPRGK